MENRKDQQVQDTNPKRRFFPGGPFLGLFWLALLVALSLVVLSLPVFQGQSLFRLLTINSSAPAVLFSDDFNRPDSATVGDGWIEVEASGAETRLQGNRLCFTDTSDLVNRPLIKTAFPKVATGEIRWKYDIDWARSQSEETYHLYMQLGDGASMSDGDRDAGVGVNLVWTQINSTHETLGYRQAGENNALAVVSGPATIEVKADLATHTYSVSINNALVQSGLPFDHPVSLGTVRFFTDEVNEKNFSGRCFDNLLVESLGLGAPASPTPTNTLSPSETPTPSQSSTATLTTTGTATATLTAEPSTSVTQYGLLELAFTGPVSLGMGSPNPFLIVLNVAFTAPDGRTFAVPGFYAGDGSGGMDGNQWKVRFSPDATGVWSYTTTSDQTLLNGQTGAFEVIPPSNCQPYIPGSLPDLDCVGRLEYTGTHYLKYANGPYWLKGGEDDPEDFLGPGITAGFTSKQAAIDYLASNGINSLYMLLHNINGDGLNVWPWVGATQAQAKANHERFDLAKMDEWESLFSYIQEKGLVLHLVLEDDSGWTGFNRSLYYREMIARFGHHNGLIWNISEEYNENYTADQAKDFAQLIEDLDPYDHPLTIHNASSVENWSAFVGDPRFDLTSFQTADRQQNGTASTWFYRVENSGRVVPISFDETGKLGVDERPLARHILWSVYMGGANFELHTSPLVQYQDFVLHFGDLHRARTFLEGFPFWEMQPMNELLAEGVGYIFAKPGSVYSVYLPNGGRIGLDLSGDAETYTVQWYNPLDGSLQPAGEVQGGSELTFDAPSTQDWTLLLQATVLPPTSTPSPTPMPTPVTLLADEFNRPNSDTVGNNWFEVESPGGKIGIESNRLCFLDTSDLVNRPIVRHSFQPVSSGSLTWTFDFDWARLRSENRYRLLMQLGDGSQMVNTSKNTGVGVNLWWTVIGGVQEMLGYRKGSDITPLAELSGLSNVSVQVDVSGRVYNLFLDGSLVQENIPFDQNVPIDTVRFLTDILNETNFAGRCFDNLRISAP